MLRRLKASVARYCSSTFSCDIARSIPRSIGTYCFPRKAGSNQGAMELAGRLSNPKFVERIRRLSDIRSR